MDSSSCSRSFWMNLTVHTHAEWTPVTEEQGLGSLRQLIRSFSLIPMHRDQCALMIDPYFIFFFKLLFSCNCVRANGSPNTADRFCMNKIHTMEIIIFKYFYISVNDRVGFTNCSRYCYRVFLNVTIFLKSFTKTVSALDLALPKETLLQNSKSQKRDQLK